MYDLTFLSGVSPFFASGWVPPSKNGTQVVSPPIYCRLLGSFFLILFTTFSSPSFAQSQQEIIDRIDNLIVGHGGFLDLNGESFIPDEKFIRFAQERYIENLFDTSYDKKYDSESLSAEQIKSLIDTAVDDDILANALFIDWFVSQDKSGQLSRLAVRNNALRAHYLDHIATPPSHGSDVIRERGIDKSILAELHSSGFSSAFPLPPNIQYILDCRNNGVPVPDKLFSSSWQNLGTFTNKVSNIPGTPRLWAHYDDDPNGSCVAATFTDEDRVHVDMICLGVNSGKACFFEKSIAGEVGEISIADMNNAGVPDSLDIGVPGMLGLCSDCHAGENPFIIHPDKPAFQMLNRTKIMPDEWHTPMVDSSWPSPGPTNILEAVDSPGKCIECHVQGYAGRFPEISSELSGYCSILKTLTTSETRRTMPALGGSYSDPVFYKKHIKMLLGLCEIEPGTTPKVVDVDLPDDDTFIGAPSIYGTIYACSDENQDTGNSGLIAVGAAGDGVPTNSSSNIRKVKVSSSIRGATIRLFVNGDFQSAQDVRNPDSTEFLLELEIGDVLTATSEFAGVKSNESTPVVVKDAMEDFADGLPRPTIRQPIFECANLIAVRHVPGARVTVSVNGVIPFTVLTSTGHTIMPTNKTTPFEKFDEFVAEASMCQLTSPPSNSISAQTAAPRPTSNPNVSPTLPFDGQELLSFTNLTHGAHTKINLDGDATELGFDWPLTSRSNFDIAGFIGRALTSTDNWTLEHTLCNITVTTEPLRGETVCDDLSAPAIEIPITGMRSVVVIDAVPGARVKIYDSNDEEIGDSSGTIVNLSRSLQNAEVIIAIQQVGNCISNQGLQVTVR